VKQELNSSARRHDLDWLRLIAIIILLFFHTGMWFNTWGWHVKNSETSISFNYWMVWLHFWRMPLLLFISGAGTILALGKRTLSEYRRERFKRLFVPLIFGMFVVVPPQIYFEHILSYSNYWSFYKTVFNFVPYPDGSFSWHHLWFVLYLLLYSLIAIPWLKFLRSEGSALFRSRASKILSHPMGMLFVPSSLILVTQIFLRPYFPEETHALLNDWAFFVFYFLFFLYGTLCYSIPEIWNSIGINRRYFVGAALGALIPFYIIYGSFYSLVDLPVTKDATETAFDVLGIFVGWFTVIATIALGQHFLNKPHRWLSIVSEGLYPFYILHQTLIIAIGYYICQWEVGIMFKFWSIALLTLLASCLLIFFVIRPVPILRLVFGLKSKPSA
jgi:hypothetical protein